MRKKKYKLSGFVALQHELLNSEAFKDLPPSASKALIFFLWKPKIHFKNPECYSVHFSFTYPEAKRLGFAPATFKRCISNLVSQGFIDPVWKGGLRGDGKSSSKFKLSERWKQYGKPDFKEISWEQFTETYGY